MEKLKLFHVIIDELLGYDKYDSFVICCKTSQEARETHPNGKREWWLDEYFFAPMDPWITPEKINDLAVNFIGTAAEGIKEGIICTSFNAGYVFICQ